MLATGLELVHAFFRDWGKMASLLWMTEPPSYGYEKNGQLVVPSKPEIFREWLSRVNIFKTRKNWIAFTCWVATLLFAIPLYFFIRYYFSWPLLIVAFFYSMSYLGTHGTIWYHRYSTHRAFTFSNKFSRFIVRNLAVKIIPEELYVISHYVHHQFSEVPGDPYNVHAGWWYCFLADANHQQVNRNLTESEYHRMSRLIDHTGVKINSYEQYKKWGSICNPYYTLLTFVLSWTFWYGVFFLIGGHALATALFGSCGVWAVGIRTFNYDGHGGGKDKRKVGIDFDRTNLSINQLWPGLVTVEWHNNHHLYPNSASNWFLPYQFDTAWCSIRFFHFIGAIRTYRDDTENFLKKSYRPSEPASVAPGLLP